MIMLGGIPPLSNIIIHTEIAIEANPLSCSILWSPFAPPNHELLEPPLIGIAEGETVRVSPHPGFKHVHVDINIV